MARDSRGCVCVLLCVCVGGGGDLSVYLSECISICPSLSACVHTCGCMHPVCVYAHVWLHASYKESNS